MLRREKKKKGNDNRKKGFVVVFIALASILIVSLTVFFSVNAFLKNRRNAQFNYELDRVDLYLLNGNLTDAAAHFQLLDSPPLGIRNGLIYLKRAWKISTGLNDYKILAKAAQAVYDENELNQDITAIYVYALLRTYDYKKAYKLAMEQLHNERFSSLIAESYLKLSASSVDLEKQENLLPEDRLLLSMTDLNMNELDSLISIYEVALTNSSDIRLVKNLVLLYCGKGEYDKAWPIAFSRLKEEAPELFLQVALDSKHYEEAFAVLNSLIQKYEENPSDDQKYLDLLLIQADVFLKTHQSDLALETYKRFIKAKEDFSVIPYRNLIPLSLELNQQQRIAYQVTDQEIYEVFSNLFLEKEPFSDPYTKDLEMILSFAELLARIDKTEQAKNFLENYIKINNQDSNINLLLYRLVDSSRPDYFISQLNFLMQQDLTNELIPLTLCHYLIAFPDRKLQLENVLRQARSIYGDKDWILFYEAWSAILSQDPANFKKSADLFAMLFNRYNLWEYAYNSAEVNNFISNLSVADEFAQKAEISLLSDKTLSGKHLKASFGKVKTLQGTIFEKKGMTEDAINAYESALQYDSSNIDAILALQKLKLGL